MNSLIFITSMLSILLLPGYAIQTIFTGRQTSKLSTDFIYTLSYSYATFTLIIGIKLAFELNWSQTSILIIGTLALSFISALLKAYKGNFQHTPSLVGSLAVIIFSIIYHVVVGPYTEIPADIYTHLEYYQSALIEQQSDRTTTLALSTFLHQGADIWYHLIAWCDNLAKLPINSVIYLTTLISKSLFLLGVYSFTLTIFTKQKNVLAIALLSTLFVALHMGINVMSYFRYYAFAPTILAYILYLAAIAAFLRLINTHSIKEFLWLGVNITALLVTTACIHTQEALFILIMIVAISIISLIRSSLTRHSAIDVALGGSIKISKLTPMLATILGLVGFSFAYYFAVNNLSAAPNLNWRLWEFDVLGLQLKIINMKFQFIQVITLWGVFVYLVSLLSLRLLKDQNFLLAGLLSPLLTVLNPFFVEFFLHIGNSTTLWRMTYISAIHFTAGFLIIKLYEDRKTVIKKIRLCLLFIVLIGLLLPINNSALGLHFSRFPTLEKTHAQRSYIQFEDLLDQLTTIKEKKDILTDPITGYLVSALTPHYSKRKKFFNFNNFKFVFKDYRDSPLAKHKGKLIIINQRDGIRSEVGAISKHWQEDILRLKKYYTPELLTHLNNNPERFELIWQSATKDIKVYIITH